MKKWEQTQCVLSEEILNNTGKQLEISPQKVLKVVVTRNNSVKVTCTDTHKTAMFEAIQNYSFAKLQEADYVARVWFCNRFCAALCTGEVIPLLKYFMH